MKFQSSYFLANGGVHVLQTFLSEQLSEEIQIKGRTARQGDVGSFSLVLLDKELEKFSITKDEIHQNQANIYNFINTKRIAFSDELFKVANSKVNNAKQKHRESINFIENLNQNDLRNAKTFIIENNS